MKEDLKQARNMANIRGASQDTYCGARKRKFKTMYDQNNPFPQYNPNAYPAYRPRRRRRIGCTIGLVLLLMLVLLTLLGAFVYQRFLGRLVPFYINPFLAGALMAGIVSVCIFSVIGFAVLNWFRSRMGAMGTIRPRSRGGRLGGCLFSLIMVGGVIALIVYGITLMYPEVDMTGIGFVQTSVNASSGANVRFVNPSNGVEQVLCVGSGQRCLSDSGAPVALNGQGLRIEPGQTVTVVFDNTGDYQVISKTTANMNMTIHIQDYSSD
jgi:plastocyanin